MIITEDQTDYFPNSQHLIQSIIKKQFVIIKGNVTHVYKLGGSIFIYHYPSFVIYAF